MELEAEAAKAPEGGAGVATAAEAAEASPVVATPGAALPQAPVGSPPQRRELEPPVGGFNAGRGIIGQRRYLFGSLGLIYVPAARVSPDERL